MQMSREIADENWDFRDGIDEGAFRGADEFRLNFSEPKKKSGTRLTREQVNALKARRLPAHLRAYLILEILSTNKSGKAIARKFNISPENVAYYRKRIRSGVLGSGAKILYRKNGALFFE